MALLQVPMTFGEGLRVTDTGGGCISYGRSPIGTDARFRGPDFSMGFRFKKINTTTSGSALIGVADSAGILRRFQLECEANSGLNLIYCRLNINVDAGTANDVVLAQIIEDTLEHSVAVTYDGDGDVNLYIDGQLVDVAPSPGLDLSSPAAAGDVFTIWGSRVPGVEIFYVDNVWFSDGIAGAAQVASLHASGLTGDS